MKFNTGMFLLIIMLICAIAVTEGSAAAGSIPEEGWRVEFFSGIPFNFATPLLISQDGGNDIYLRQAQYLTRPFENPIYYALRVGRWRNDKGLEVELMHQKLYLQNKPAGVQHFEISHGYNLITVNRAWRRNGLIFRVGGGVVLAHPDITVRNKTLSDGGLLDTGYYLAGPVLGVSAGKTTPLTEKLYLNTEVKITAASAVVPVQSGESIVPNTALHLLLGLGYCL